METYKDKVSGETLYVSEREYGTYYYKDKARKILHRVDGPAMEWDDGTYSWYRNGKSHRMDGPAYADTRGYKDWLIDGVHVTFMGGKYFGPYNLQAELNDIKRL